MEIKPILSALGRHRVAALLITFEIALACAVLCNALFLIATRLDLMRVQSGVDESSLAIVALNGCDGCVNADVNARALAALRAIPGVRAAGVLNSVPFGEIALNAGIRLEQDGEHYLGVPHFYTFGPDAVAALGLRPVQGTGFAPEDFQALDGFLPPSSRVWITQALATHLWPGENALGKSFWSGDSRLQVAGILAHLAHPTPGGSEDGAAAQEWSVVVPTRDDAQVGTYVVRADPLDVSRVAQAARQALARAIPEAVIDQARSRTLGELRERYFQRDRAMTGLLVTVAIAMLLVTALGIVGLASFWVAQRTKQIGVRRALGATRGDILRYFQTENFLLSTGGIALGMLLAYGGNQLLMHYFELNRLPLFYLPAGAALLWAVGQLAVLGPALRAAAVPPVIATRSA
ncbi:ABC transporter permease [Pseudoxanthomonas composti]|uniref:FtsX-like permease family protein n=1 Tax=Pseudoxanthomonas composti TaxID=2137479 RepID=A0A4Q1JSA6_9GAMM|nr:FtsX-like permease family protein [Pseudoxanthomonas composti]RXR02066.1 FtsX-like permease family protein [Pseudoxanthomonas composti]